MFDNKVILNKLIDWSIVRDNKPPILKWKYKSSNKNKLQYYSFYSISKTKKICFILTKSKLPDRSNYYLDIYLNSNKSNIFSILIDEKQYNNIGCLFVTKYPLLLKLYGIIKFDNLITDKDNYIKNLKEWTKSGDLKWEKNTDGDYIIYDIKDEWNIDLYIKNLLTFKKDKDWVFISSISLIDNLIYQYNFINGNGLYKIIEENN
jgi:hypothetical protein